MIIPDKAILATFVREGWQQGLLQLCRDRAQKAIRELKEVDAMSAKEITRIQAEIRFWEKDLPSVVDAVNEYSAQLAVTPK